MIRTGAHLHVDLHAFRLFLKERLQHRQKLRRSRLFCAFALYNATALFFSNKVKQVSQARLGALPSRQVPFLGILCNNLRP